jgi:ferredoxin-NADP reductase
MASPTGTTNTTGTTSSLVLPVRDIARVTPGSSLVRLALGADAFRFAAGQAVNLGRHGQARRKPYSIANAPADAARDGVLEFLVGLEDERRFGDHLGELAAGALVDVEGPFGSFGLPPGEWARFVFVAGGTGIAPLRSMWRQLRRERLDADVAIVYSVRRRSDVAFAAELDALAREGRATVTITATREPAASTWSGERGRLSARRLAPHVTPGTAFVVCGPPAFVRHVASAAREIGIRPEQLITEQW